jgi:hypothetical protein
MGKGKLEIYSLKYKNIYLKVNKYIFKIFI